MTAAKKKKRRKQSRPKISSDEQHARFVKEMERWGSDGSSAEAQRDMDRVIKHKPSKKVAP